MIGVCENPKLISGMAVICGKCAACKKARAREWSLRGRHEHLTNSKCEFITLTYNDAHLLRRAKKAENENDQKGILIKTDLQKFIKRFREHIRRIYNRKIKYLACGEYGEESWRPHYHLVIFGTDITETPKSVIQSLWKFGLVDVNNGKPLATDQSIAYVAGYINKKLTDTNDWEHYEGNGRPEPFQLMSKGLGNSWADRYEKSWTNKLKCGINGADVNVPRAYIKRVYKKEGKVLKLKNINIYARNFKSGVRTKEVESIYYKVFINPEGELTKKILDIQAQRRIASMIKNGAKNEDIERQKKADNEKIEKYRYDWQYINSHNTNECIEKYTTYSATFTDRIYDKSEQSTMPIGITPQKYTELNENASEKCKKIKKNLKFRDKIEAKKWIENLILNKN